MENEMIIGIINDGKGRLEKYVDEIHKILGDKILTVQDVMEIYGMLSVDIAYRLLRRIPSEGQGYWLDYMTMTARVNIDFAKEQYDEQKAAEK